MSKSLAPIVESIWKQQLESFDSGNLLTAEEILETHPELRSDVESAVDVIFNEYEIRRRLEHTPPDPDEFVDRFPQYGEALRRQFNLLQAFDSATLRGVASAVEDEWAGTEKERFTDRTTIGQGATAIVESAYDELLKHKVALKKLHTHLQSSRRAMHRLKREAQTVARLHHPNIVPLYELADDGRDVTLVSRFIDGKNLKDVTDSNGISDISNAVEWTRQIADALDYAHANNVTHRDVKPSNILVDENGNALLTDFGMASFAESANEITQTGELIGTPAYMSPEQARGDTREVGKHSDIYSLGATLYFLLTGRPPFEGSFPAVVKQVIEKELPPLRSGRFSIPPDLSTIVGKCLLKNPQERYLTARELADDLKRFQDGDVILARPAGFIEKALKKIRKRPLTSLGVATILLLAAFLSGSLLQLDQVRKQRNRAQTAEVTNRELHALSSIDAGKLALQRGHFDKAIDSFEMGISQGVNRPDLVNLNLVEAHLAKGDFEKAKHFLDLAKGLRSEESGPEFKYWQNEFAVVSDANVEFTPFKDDEFKLLEQSKQCFIQGLNSETSEEALAKFREAVNHDPTHHGARRMSLIMALSLARFDEVLEEVKLARSINPGDIDFQLIEALALSASGDQDASLKIIEASELPVERKVRWNSFCEFLFETANEGADTAQDIDGLDFVAEVLARFGGDFLELTMERRWRFPAKISKQFAVLDIAKISTMEAVDVVEMARQLVEVHPEGTLMYIAGEAELKSENPVEDFERSRDYFYRSTKTPSFVKMSKDASWLGVYVTSMILNLQLKHEPDINLEFMVEAAPFIDVTKDVNYKELTIFFIPLISRQKYDAARRFVERAIELAENDAERSQAWWHMALIHQKQGRWQNVLECCAEVKETLSDDFKPREDWAGMKGHSIGEMNKLMK